MELAVPRSFAAFNFFLFFIYTVFPNSNENNKKIIIQFDTVVWKLWVRFNLYKRKQLNPFTEIAISNYSFLLGYKTLIRRLENASAFIQVYYYYCICLIYKIQFRNVAYLACKFLHRLD